MGIASAMVTGATGCIGSRHVETLRATGTRVHVLLRDGARAPQMRALGCQVVRGDVTLPDTVTAAARNCEVVFHCAVGGGDLAQARRINVEGTLNVMRAARDGGARRVIHLSSVVAHGRRRPAVLTESCPLVFHGDHYAATKAESERAAEKFAAEAGLELTILRPTIVYGPRSGRIVSDLQRVRMERVKLIRHGRGLLDLVFVDDVVAAMLCAADPARPSNEAFLVSGHPAMTCADYFGALAAMCEKPVPPGRGRLRSRVEAFGSRWYFRFTRHPRRIEDTDFGFMGQRSRVSIGKAAQRLGWAPEVTFAEGMRRTEAWLRSTGYLPARRDDAVPARAAHGA